MIEIMKTVFGLAVLSFVITYGLWYVGLATDSIFAYFFGERDWGWD